MAKPLNQFGGWLRFFQVVNILGLVVMPIAVIISLVAGVAMLGLGDPFGFLYFGIGIVDLSVYFALTIMILIQLSKRESTVPAKIQKLLTIQVAVSIVLGLSMIPISDFSPNIGTETALEIFRDIGRAISFYVVWNMYFGKSERVQAVFAEKGSTSSRKVFVDLPGASTVNEVRKEVPEVVRSFES